jgi:hypothetical protein
MPTIKHRPAATLFRLRYDARAMTRITRAILALAILSISMCSAQTPAPGKADPAIYPKMRTNALAKQNCNLPAEAICVVMID